MSQVRGFEGRRWQLALGVSVGLHVTVISGMRFAEWPQRPPSEAIVPLEVWLSDWRPDPPPEPVEPEQAIEEPEPEPEPDTAVDETTPSDNEAEVVDDDSEAPPSRSFTPIRRSIDWDAEARRVVVMMREAQEQSESYVDFGMPFELIEGLDSRRDDNLAEVERRLNERGGVPERSSSGDLVLYDENGCYQILEPGSMLLADANRFFNLSPLGGGRCPRPAETRTDLFEEQKPEYLKD